MLKKFLTYRNPGPLYIPRDGWGSQDEQIPLPSWLSEDDIKYYVSKFEKTGFTGGLNYYRALDMYGLLSLSLLNFTLNLLQLCLVLAIYFFNSY